MWGLVHQLRELRKENEALKKALLYAWRLRDRDEPVFVVINYTDRRAIRGILGRALCKKLGI